jgi:hypothetical protein
MTYTVTLTLQSFDANSPYDAVIEALETIKKSANTLIYDVEEEEGEERNKYTVDLSEDEEDAVLLNND